MNILVTGANGQLGLELRNFAAGSRHHFIFTDISTVPGIETVYLDITNRDAVRIIARSENVDVIVNCAAYTNVEKAEDDLAFADLLNHGAPENLAAVAVETGAALIHVSTDYVFGGDSSVPYREDDPKSPLGVYGSTKLAGELAVQNSGCKYIILRTAWLYSPYGKNFVKTMKLLTAEKESVKVVADQVGSPTYAADLAGLIGKILEDNLLDHTGVYHFTDEGVISWYDLAETVRAVCGNKGKVLPCRTEDYPTKAARPHYSVLDKTLVKETFGVEIPYWRDSLEACLERLGNQ